MARPPLIWHALPSCGRARHPGDGGANPAEGEGEDGARCPAAARHCARQRVPAAAQSYPARRGEARGGGVPPRDA
eukprot:1726573-Prymnesium_polylepis.1